ncbi:hypothetical protein [Natronosalvus caseinilyticus]|uniref:hypothetical protein n=1 Tax=Natronosalvus caseinilyticus TaxID=2953747 RepID=UPI0028A6FE71|nr:hypothetical protein [Natronosalvus caseinilyticus]
MLPRLRRFLVMLGGAVVAAAVITLLFAPPTLVAGVVTFAIVMVAGATLSYVIGYLETPWATPGYVDADAEIRSRRHTETADRDAEELRWAIREGIGVAIASLFGLLLLVAFLLQATTLFTGSALTATQIGVWAVIAILGITMMVLGLWSWRGRDGLESGDTQESGSFR